MIKDLARQYPSGFLLVGLINENKLFPRGEVSSVFKNKICELASFYKVNKIRSHAMCEICIQQGNVNGGAVSMDFNGKYIGYGGADIIVVGKKREVYISPDLIFHYVVDHNYLPPKEYVDAVEALDLTSYQVGKSIFTTSQFLEKYPLTRLMLLLRRIFGI